MGYMRIMLVLLLSAIFSHIYSQSITGTVRTETSILPYASIILDGNKTAVASEEGTFGFDLVAPGHHTLSISYLGYKEWSTTVKIKEGDEAIVLDCVLEESLMTFDEIVVTGSKTFKRQTNSAVIVNVVDSKTLDNVQACNLSEGLKFQPGLRVETDCQTCNYTQLRMNGLAGGYSQILINGRPIFSPLTGLYGLEQIPVNMIDKIEVIRGGGSSLYGSSAIGGTVNVFTKIPNKNQVSINTSYQNIAGSASDYMTSGNATLVHPSKKSGLTLFLNNRQREAYDHNGDNFSEIPEIENFSVGLGAFYLPASNQKIEVNLSKLNEYRYGGELVDKPAHEALQSEERTHDVWMGSIDYQINMDAIPASIISYLAWQNTVRDHYTGIVPDEEDVEAFNTHIENPPYGDSETTTIQAGFQLNYETVDFLGGSNVFTLGTEWLLDDTYDEIPAYNYLVDQETRDLGVFLQSDWEIVPALTLLSGIRMDKHNLVDRLLTSPRLSLLYKYGENTQIRASYGSGFRAPQAFDTDLHIAFSGGGISRVVLSDDLKEETSRSYSVSLNYDKPSEHWVAGFTVEGFYTKLDDAFALIPIGEDAFGEVFEKRNDQGATVQGMTLELRGNYNRKIQLEGGLTIQSSRFENAVAYIDEVPGVERFIRTPNVYGFANLTFTPTDRFNANLNYVYTGSMLVPHFAGAPNQLIDEIIESPTFSELSSKIGYVIPLNDAHSIEIYGGVKNMLNGYQETFDVGKNRDSNFVYGPGMPRTYFVGVKWGLN